jgi:hypothetical protein
MINLGNNYAIGLTNPPTKLTQFGIPDPFPTEFNLSAFPPKTTGGRLQFFSGKPQAKWKFGMLEQRELNVLLGYVTGASSDVYITTKILTGVVPYATFSATMHYPKIQSKPGGLWSDVEIEFWDLVNA